MDTKSIFVVGPTATGKTELAVSIADSFGGEIISVDSRQVYISMDIGTGKDLRSYKIANRSIAYHLIDIISPHEEYNLYRFLQDASNAYTDIISRNQLAIFAGGSSLYINALLNSYSMPGEKIEDNIYANNYSKEELANILKKKSIEKYKQTDLTQKRRIIRALEILKQSERSSNEMILPKLNSLIIAPYYPRKITHERIKKRLAYRFSHGLVEEVQYLHDNLGVSYKKLDRFGLEYRYIAKYLQKELTKEETFEILFIKIRQFCKSQDIWYRKIEKEGHDIYWIEKGNLAEAKKLVTMFLEGKELPEPKIKISKIHYGPQTN